MGDVSLNRPIKAEPAAGGIAKGNRNLDLMSAGWTDERHMLYISSMEASFVDQLYGLEQSTHRAKRNGTDCGYGFKVLRRGVWESLGFDRARARGGGRCTLSANPWIRHFRPCNRGGNEHGDPVEASVDDHESGTRTIRRAILPHGREFRAFKGENLDNSTEVSDQNFSDGEVEIDAESSKKFKKRRLNCPWTVPNDQVVPSGKLDADSEADQSQDDPKKGMKG